MFEKVAKMLEGRVYNPGFRDSKFLESRKLKVRIMGLHMQCLHSLGFRFHANIFESGNFGIFVLGAPFVYLEMSAK